MEKSRFELYELVWAKPMTHLAKELGLSDVGLRKICVKFGVPLPQRGYCVEWHPKLSHFEENLHPNLSHPNRLSCLIFEQGWARSDQRGNFEQITQTCPSRQGLHPTS